MQISQSVPWLTFVMSIVPPILVQIFVAYWLSKVSERNKIAVVNEIEDYKKEINKELEEHRARLQEELQTRLYLFQTKYSFLHQKQAVAIEELFAFLARVQNDLQVLAAWDRVRRSQTKAEFFFKTLSDLQTAIDFFDEKRIYFDESIGKGVRILVSTATMLIESLESSESVKNRSPELASEINQNIENLLNDNLHPVMNRLENMFKAFLAAESARDLPTAPTTSVTRIGDTSSTDLSP